MRKFFTFFCVIIFILGSFKIGQFIYHLYVWKYEGEEKQFVIKDGENFSKINFRLKEDKFILNSSSFYRYCKWNNYLAKFKSGVYLIPKNISNNKLIEMFVKGESDTVLVTVPEGRNIYEVARILEQYQLVNYREFIEKTSNKGFLNKLGIPYSSMEGFLYPETYRLSKVFSTEVIIKQMYNEFKKKTSSINFTHSSLSYYQIIILASIVEKETSVVKEQPLVASVFLNRLKKGIRLQSDPTTIYGKFEQFNGNLSKKDLSGVNEYNTYKINGLPKGPITSPSITSIEAVLNAPKSEYLYFVSRGDGTHVFSTQYKDHVNAVNFFQKHRDLRAVQFKDN